MILAVLFANSKGNILVERPDSLDFFTKLPSLFAWSGLFTLFTWCLEMSASMLLCKYEYDELAAEVIFVITSAVKDVCGKLPTERLFLEAVGAICFNLTCTTSVRLKKTNYDLSSGHDYQNARINVACGNSLSCAA
ncbi:hypothetical protein GOBAR_DD08063 [Gossypium barbadense]|nr:hypothetical protein GOBAR_DD08063 [Gossypium barbadense]